MWLRNYHSEARLEFDEAVDWYLDRDPRAALRFLFAVDEITASIVTDPERYELIAPELRAVRIPKFPYRMIYRIHRDEVQVVAVAHTSRRPGYWNARLDS